MIPTKKSLLLAFLSFIIVSAWAQDIVVPAGVKYKKADDKLNTKAQELVTSELQGEATYEIFSGSLFIGPRLWSRYVKIQDLKNIKAGNVTYYIPQFDEKGKAKGTEKATGKLIQTKEDYKLLWRYIRADFKGVNLKCRKLTPIEMSYYWSIISFDIEEPIFVVDNGKYKLLVNFTPEEMKIFWIEEV